MADNPIDLDAYFARVGYSGPRTPTLDTLRALHALHPAAIPFEAIDVLLGRGVDLTPAAVDAKLIAAKRGGYCFEQNNLFMRALTALGFAVEGLAARVRYLVPQGSPRTPRTHMALRVTIDGAPWLADVGFGGCVASAPLRLDTDEAQPTGHEPFRLAHEDGSQVLHVLRGEDWHPLYELLPERQYPSDYDLGNWFTSAHPDSLFKHVMMIARVTPQARYALLDNRFTLRKPGGKSEQRLLNAKELERSLAEDFGLPVEPSWRPVIERVAAKSSS